MARSMNGINNIEVNEVEFPDGSIITSAANLVQLDTNNNFISNNTFNVNLPTSTVNPNIGDINDNTILNKFSADKLYPDVVDVNECFDGVTINNQTLTFTRVDNANPQDILIPSTDLTNVVLKTTAQTIDGVKTFNDLPICSTAPTNNTQLANKKYVDDEITTVETNVVLKTTAQTIDGIKTFNDLPICSTAPSSDTQLANKKYVDDNGGSGDAILSAGTTASPQVFTGNNTFTDNIIYSGSSNSNVGGFSMTGTFGNSIQQSSSTAGNEIEQKGQSNEIVQSGTHNVSAPNIISTTGFIRMLQPPAIGTDCCNKTYVDAQTGGGFVGHRNFLNSSSGAAQRPIIFTGVDYDTGMYNTSTGIITIPSSGHYLFICCWNVEQKVQFQAGFIQPALINKSARVGGNFYEKDFINQISSDNTVFGTTAKAVTGQVVLECIAGDTYQWNNERQINSFIYSSGIAERYSNIMTYKI